MLTLADLETEEAVGLKQMLGLGNEAAVDVEAFGTGEESGRWLVFADLGMKIWAIGSGDVGWVADDGVEGCAGRQGREEIGMEEADAVGYMMVFGVELGEVESLGGDVDSGNVSIGEMDGQSDRDSSGAGAYIGD